MKIERTKNAFKNLIYGTIFKIYSIIFPFIIRTIMIYFLGMEYVGLNGLFTSILQVLNVAELGVGVAMVYSMYKPIADDDGETICALMQLYKKYYRIIGCIIAIIGLAIIPLIPKFVTGDVPDGINLYNIYLLNLGATVLSYWLFAYKNSLLAAHQRLDISNKINIFSNTIQYIAQIIILVWFKNYYLFLVCLILGQIINNIWTSIITTKLFPKYKTFGKLNQEKIKEINGRIKDLFTAKLGGVIQSSFASIIISSFLGLVVLGIYNNYYFIMISVFGFITVAFNSILAGVGNSIIIETKEKNYKDFLKLFFIVEWIIGFCSCCFLCLFQPFMKIWVGVENLLSIQLVICLVIYFICITTNQMLCVYKDSAGMWNKDRFRPLITAFVNLALNLATVQWLGLFGVVLSTVVSMLFVGTPWLIHNLFHEIFKRKSGEFIKKLLIHTSVTIFSCCLSWLLCNLIIDNGIFTLLIKFVICILIPNLVFIILFYRVNEFKSTLQTAKSILKKK